MAQPFVPPCQEGVIAAQPCPEEAGRRFALTRQARVLAGCVLVSSMAFIDGSALTVAMPALKADFGADMAAVQWVVSAYILALAALTLIGGALADAYGKARLVVAGAVVFAFASVACALAPAIEALIAARAVQGVGGALMTPATLALIGAVFPKEKRASAIGVWAAASALTTAGGPALGGWLTETYGWQSIFWINPPLAAIGVALILQAAPRLERIPRRFDAPGAAILAVGLGLLAWGLSLLGGGAEGGPVVVEGGHSEGGMTSAAALWGLGLGVAALLAYVVWETRTDHPMTPPRLFTSGPFTALNLMTFFVYAGLSLMFFLLPFELVEGRGLSATQAGLAFLPFTLGVGLLSRVFGGLTDKGFGRAMLTAGPALASVGYFGLALGREASFVVGVILPMGVLGVAFATLVAPLTATVMSSVPEHDEGLASGVNNAASRVAQLAGVAGAAALAVTASGFSLGLGVAAGLSLLGAACLAFVKV